MKVSVLCFDCSTNAAGRALLLAQLLAPRYEVEVVGPCFRNGLWRPAVGTGIPFRTLPGARYPRFLATIPRLMELIGGDLLYASKSRPTSFGLGLLARRRIRRPLLLDIDDWETGFFYHSGSSGTIGRFLNLSNPNGLPWTWCMEKLVARADALTVASRFLQGRFGGTLMPHVRDTDQFDPDRADPKPIRSLLAAEGRHLVVFLGTVRAYKGVDDLAEAVRRLNRPDLVLAVIGCSPESRAGQKLSLLGDRVRLIEEVPFHRVPDYLAAADLVVIPQRASTDTVGQVPAKIFDAMAMARPIISTRVSMIPEVLESAGLLVEPGRVDQLADAMAHLLDHPAEAQDLGQKARARAVRHYSFEAVRPSLFELVDRVLAHS
ncbi:MAG TPA: glycosyltransferase family 4 protein [Methylomirabilota bacterium]|nr:glycosyltransferase family 4 protein [Methylomirabilota bacterium]